MAKGARASRCAYNYLLVQEKYHGICTVVQCPVMYTTVGSLLYKTKNKFLVYNVLFDEQVVWILFRVLFWRGGAGLLTEEPKPTDVPIHESVFLVLGVCHSLGQIGA